MTKLEMALVAFSILETVISAFLYRRMIKEKTRYEKLYNEYQQATVNLLIWRNAA